MRLISNMLDTIDSTLLNSIVDRIGGSSYLSLLCTCHRLYHLHLTRVASIKLITEKSDLSTAKSTKLSMSRYYTLPNGIKHGRYECLVAGKSIKYMSAIYINGLKHGSSNTKICSMGIGSANGILDKFTEGKPIEIDCQYDKHCRYVDEIEHEGSIDWLQAFSRISEKTFGGALHGKCETFEEPPIDEDEDSVYPRCNTKKTIYYYNHGVKEGPHEEYCDGILSMRAHYKNGILHGTYEMFDRSGQVAGTCEYVNGSISPHNMKDVA